MNPRTPRRAAEASPGPLAAKSCPCEPLAPVAAGQGDPATAGKLLEAPAVAGPQTPEARVGGEPSRASGHQPEALSGKAFRDAVKAAQSAKAKKQRQQRARPWQGRDPLRNAVPGGRKLPPKDGA